MQPSEVETCAQCLRPKFTQADLERWRSEVAAVTRLGGDAVKHNPEWARALCWTRREFNCISKPASTEEATHAAE